MESYQPGSLGSLISGSAKKKQTSGLDSLFSKFGPSKFSVSYDEKKQERSNEVSQMGRKAKIKKEKKEWKQQVVTTESQFDSEPSAKIKKRHKKVIKLEPGLVFDEGQYPKSDSETKAVMKEHKRDMKLEPRPVFNEDQYQIPDSRSKEKTKKEYKKILKLETESVSSKDHDPVHHRDHYETFNQHKSLGNRDPAVDKRTIFVGNLPDTIKRKALKKHFLNFGKVQSVRLRNVTRKDCSVPKKVAVIKGVFHPDRHNINAYVTFESEENAQEALQANGSIIGNLHIHVDMADNKSHNNKTSVFVGNLPFAIEEERLRLHFSSCPGITGVRIIRDSYSGAGKGFGYINFESTSSVALALKLNGTIIDDRILRVQRCARKPKNKNTTASTNHHDKKRYKKKSQFGSKYPKPSGAFQGNTTAETGRFGRHKKNWKSRGDSKKRNITEKLMKTMKSSGSMKQTSYTGLGTKTVFD